MKKIFFICLSAAFISTSFAQSSVVDVPENKIKPAYETAPAIKSTDNKVTVAQKPVLSSVIANAHGTPAQVTTTSKPATEQPAPVVSTTPSSLVSITATRDDMPVQVKQQPVITTATSVKPTVTQTNVKSPAVQMIPVQTLKTSPVMETPVGTKPVETSASKAMSSGSVVAIPVPTISTSDAGQEVKTVPANKMPEQVLGQPKATEAIVTPPSVINSAKTPVKQN